MAGRQRALGYAETFDGNGNVVVKERLTCVHCQQIFDKPGPGEEVGFCHFCFCQVCAQCGKLDKCDPFEKKLARMEASARLLKEIGIA